MLQARKEDKHIVQNKNKVSKQCDEVPAADGIHAGASGYARRVPE
jgi:hypothetical protein